MQSQRYINSFFLTGGNVAEPYRPYMTYMPDCHLAVPCTANHRRSSAPMTGRLINPRQLTCHPTLHKMRST